MLLSTVAVTHVFGKSEKCPSEYSTTPSKLGLLSNSIAASENEPAGLNAADCGGRSRSVEVCVYNGYVAIFRIELHELSGYAPHHHQECDRWCDCHDR